MQFFSLPLTMVLSALLLLAGCVHPITMITA